jgi:hypothetical protein
MAKTPHVEYCLRHGRCRLQGLLAHFGAPGARRGARGAPPARPSQLVAGITTNHLKGGLPVLGVRFGGLKAAKVHLQLLLPVLLGAVLVGAGASSQSQSREQHAARRAVHSKYQLGVMQSWSA